MTTVQKRVGLRVCLAVWLLGTAFVPACQQERANCCQGYVEGEFTYVSSPLGGRLVKLAVTRGEEVSSGVPLFELDSELEEEGVGEAESRLLQARARLANLEKGSRPSEMKGLMARLRQAEAARELSQSELKRHEALFASHAVSQSTLDRARAAHLADVERVREIQSNIETADQGARSDEIQAAQNEVSALAARVTQARWSLEQKKQVSPAAGLIFETFYTEGEWVQPGRPVVAMLADGHIKVRFFVPEPEFAGWQLGERVALACDGCPGDLGATVDYLSPNAEYTPPVIYSQETRSKLVYRVEALPDAAASRLLHPGQPVVVCRDQRAVEPAGRLHTEPDDAPMPEGENP